MGLCLDVFGCFFFVIREGRFRLFHIMFYYYNSFEMTNE